jgi:hypothetical protein
VNVVGKKQRAPIRQQQQQQQVQQQAPVSLRRVKRGGVRKAQQARAPVVYAFQGNAAG